MEACDIDAGLRLCRASGWNQIARDWELLLMLSPRGSFVAAGETGEVIGSVVTLRYRPEVSWIAMMLVDPAHRRRGIGRTLLAQALQELSDERSIGLDATPAGFGLYGACGFREQARLHRWERPAGAVPRPHGDWRVRKVTSIDTAVIARIDHAVFGADRRLLLKSLVNAAPSYAWIIDGPGDAPRGYCLGRSGFAFEQVGPLVAEDAAIAGTLLASCLAERPERPFVLDVPDAAATDLHVWLHAFGFSKQRPFIRMYHGPWTGQQHGSHQVFAIMGPEFG
jgi:GNAT superfamily N-acetyltransferase